VRSTSGAFDLSLFLNVKFVNRQLPLSMFSPALSSYSTAKFRLSTVCSAVARTAQRTQSLSARLPSKVSHFHQNKKASTNFSKNTKYGISRKSVGCGRSFPYAQTDRQTDSTTLTVAFLCNCFANAPTNTGT
jgi:hypothetical protein